MKPEQVPLPVSVKARAAAIRYAERNRVNVNLDMLGGIVDAAVAAVMPMIQAQARQHMSSVSCPFDRADHSGLSEEDPCPVCGALGTSSSSDPLGKVGNCVSRYR